MSSSSALIIFIEINIMKDEVKSKRQSSMLVLAVQATAFLSTFHSILKALTVILQAFRLRTFTAPIRPVFLHMIRWINILTVYTLAFSPAYSSIRKTVTII